MTKISFVLFAALSFAACKKGGGDCAKAIDNSMSLSKAEMSKMPGNDEKMMKKMSDLGLQHCKDDKWGDEAIKCMSDAKAMADAQGCYGKLTPDQREKMQKAAMELMTPPTTGSAGSAAPAPAAPAGSAN